MYQASARSMAAIASGIDARIRSRVSADRGASTPPFRYRSFGSMATIGRKSAVAQFGKVKISGQLAWLLWGLAHIYFLIGFRNRVAVVTNWLWHYVTFQSGTRLITGMSGADMDDMGPPPAAVALMPDIGASANVSPPSARPAPPA